MTDVQKNLEALKIALKTEEDGYQLYKKGAEQAEDKFVKSIFEQLFKDELMHMDLIKRFYAELNEAGSWAEMSPEEKNYKGLKGELKTIFSNALENVETGKEKITDADVEVYKKAIQFEKDGVKLYSRLYDETEDEKAKKFYAFLRDMEQEHADVLDDAYQYLEDPNNWYLNQEGWTLDY